MSRTKKGFTLIELLIVLAILGIIAAIAIPALATAAKKRRAKRMQQKTITISMVVHESSRPLPTLVG